MDANEGEDVGLFIVMRCRPLSLMMMLLLTVVGNGVLTFLYWSAIVMVMMVVAIGTTPAGLVACCRFLSFVDFFVVVVFAVVVFINSFQCVEHTHLTTHFHSTAPVKHFLLFDKAAAAAAAVFVLVCRRHAKQVSVVAQSSTDDDDGDAPRTLAS